MKGYNCSPYTVQQLDTAPAQTCNYCPASSEVESTFGPRGLPSEPPKDLQHFDHLACMHSDLIRFS